MPNYMLRISFVGSRYHGWQIQPGLPTVQGTLTDALERILSHRVRLVGCCRTDAGVHARDYVANFTTHRELSEEKLLLSLNSLLPKDIGVLAV
ncbi:MAG TPA: tRNA pseudouridine(38-40) synthase TruA, partial [Aquifex aeolicus]|nr:tRNA pseudouridine(38-40) synthase TruA [Aquifex aeolicus]